MQQGKSSRASTTWALAAALALLGAPLAAAALPSSYATSQQAKLVPDAVETEDRFAHAIAADEDLLVLGNARNGDGEVYVYERTSEGPVPTSTIQAPTGYENVGEALALEDDTLVVGAPSTDTDDVFASGAALVYEIDDGQAQLQQTLVSTDPGTIERFGSALALEDGVLAVAEPEDAPNGYDSNGAVHVYEEVDDRFVHQQKILPPADDDKERLGYVLALEDGTLYAGAPEDQAENSSGSVILHEDEGSTWTSTETITAPQGAEAFGRALAVDGDTMVVGAPGPQVHICCDPTPDSKEGQAFVLQAGEDGWEEPAQLDPAVSTTGASVGLSVAVHEDRAFVAAPTAPADTVVGTVSVFEDAGDEWRQTGEIHSQDPASGDRLGATIAAPTGELIATAPGDDEGGHNAGAAYVFADVAPGIVSTPE